MSVDYNYCCDISCEDGSDEGPLLNYCSWTQTFSCGEYFTPNDDAYVYNTYYFMESKGCDPTCQMYDACKDATYKWVDYTWHIAVLAGGISLLALCLCFWCCCPCIKR